MHICATVSTTENFGWSPEQIARSRPGAQAVEHHRHFGVDLCEILDPFTRNELVAVVRVTGLTDQVMALRSANNLGFGSGLTP